MTRKPGNTHTRFVSGFLFFFGREKWRKPQCQKPEYKLLVCNELASQQGLSGGVLKVQQSGLISRRDVTQLTWESPNPSRISPSSLHQCFQTRSCGKNKRNTTFPSGDCEPENLTKFVIKQMCFTWALILLHVCNLKGNMSIWTSVSNMSVLLRGLEQKKKLWKFLL